MNDELSAQEEESKSAVNQLMVQIQEPQDKANSLSGAKEFFDPETASSSGLSHVPSQPVSVPSPRFLLAACYTELIWFIRTRVIFKHREIDRECE